MEQMLSQTEIDALLSAVNDGQIEDEAEGGRVDLDGAAEVALDVVKYDLLSQDRIIRGRMPTLDIINDRFARQLRVTLSNMLRKMIQVSVESTSLMKYGEFLNYLPIPSCLNVVKMHPLRGACILAMEAKLVFAFLNNFFGGSTNAQERVEGRDFTAIELMVIRKVVKFLLADLERAWQPVFPLNGEHIRTEINPQFLAVVPPTEVVVLTSYELDLEDLRGTLQVVLPYSTVEPIRHNLSSGAQGEAEEEDDSWRDQMEYNLDDVPVDVRVELGQTAITVRELLDLDVGDVIPLTQDVNRSLMMKVAGHPKFEVEPMVKGGHLAVRPVRHVLPRPEHNKSEQRALEDLSKADPGTPPA